MVRTTTEGVDDKLLASDEGLLLASNDGKHEEDVSIYNGLAAGCGGSRASRNSSRSSTPCRWAGGRHADVIDGIAMPPRTPAAVPGHGRVVVVVRSMLVLLRAGCDLRPLDSRSPH